MKLGYLVKVTRASIGIPVGTIGLIVSTHNVAPWADELIIYHDVQLCGLEKARTVRRMPRDLEAISATEAT